MMSKRSRTQHSGAGLRTAKMVAGLLVIGWVATIAVLQPWSASRAAATTLNSAVSDAVNQASNQGITQYVSIIDRSTGKVLYSTSNATTPVASESIVKLYIAVWWLHQTNGNAAAVSCGDIGYMVRESDDDTATSCWRQDILSDVSSWYGLTNSYNNPSDWTYWGAAHISAADVATLLYRAANDPLVGDWLTTQMGQTTSISADGYDQDFGFRAITGAESKQGWDNDGYWLPETGMIHTAGYVGNVAAVVLQMGDLATQEDLMHTTSTATAQAIADNSQQPATISTNQSTQSAASTVPPSASTSSTAAAKAQAANAISTKVTTSSPAAQEDFWASVRAAVHRIVGNILEKL
ncbi:hypothetical protein [Propionibacterium sp.]|uniref:hypothetical protein n=1 Tax=Propionibacterium sp. TaxID=1977903 RepID=UPI0039ED8167